jgi:hypothetical protein
MILKSILIILMFVSPPERAPLDPPESTRSPGPVPGTMPAHQFIMVRQEKSFYVCLMSLKKKLKIVKTN